MVERGGWKPRNKKAAFNAGEQGGINSGEETKDKKKQKSKPFSADLARRINDQFMGALPDSTKLSEMYRPGGGPKSQGKWREFLQGLDLRERVVVSAAAIPLFRAGYPNIGSVRKAEIEDLCEITHIPQFD